jgi:ribosomal protein L22
MTPPEHEDTETPETESEPRRLLRRRWSRGAAASGDTPASGASADAPASEAARSEPESDSQAEAARGASSADASPDSEQADEIEETPEDLEAEEAAADVMLEADAEAEGEAAEAEPEAAEGEAEPASVDEGDEGHGAEEAAAVAEVEAEEEPEAEEEEVGAPRPPAPAPTRRRRGQRAERRDVVVRAQAKYVRCSARKARLVCDHIRGKSVEEARAILAHTPRAVARDWSKLLESAVANAENNHELVGEDLYVMAVHADEGPTIRRFRPRAMGRATRIRKRTSHLTILLTPKD